MGCSELRDLDVVECLVQVTAREPSIVLLRFGLELVFFQLESTIKQLCNGGSHRIFIRSLSNELD